MDILITSYLDKQGQFKRSNKGFFLLREAIKLCVYKPHISTMAIYETLAVQTSSTRSRVERSIRHSIETSGMKHVKSGEFIAKAADDIRLSEPA